MENTSLRGHEVSLSRCPLLSQLQEQLLVGHHGHILSLPLELLPGSFLKVFGRDGCGGDKGGGGGDFDAVVTCFFLDVEVNNNMLLLLPPFTACY